MVVKLTMKKTAKGTSIDKPLSKAVEDLPDGVYNIYISEVGYTTSVPQRKLFWMWMGCLEYETGTERKKWHDYYVKKFLPPEKHGISDISSKAMHHFMEQIKADAATEYGITLPLPSDLDYNDFILEYKYR